MQNFLLQDEQTAITPQVRAVADLANDNKDFSTLAEIFALLKAAERRGRAMSVSGRKHTNTASQILSAVRVSGCTDCAIAFATLARAKGIPALVVDSARKEWIDGGVSRENGEGHFFVEVYIGDRWHLVDPVRGLLYRNDGTPKGYNPENWNLPGGYLAFAKALSVVD
ncbi:MAG: transglutaminase domain-containing protein, partial [Alphaproteobacteria bacterium]|nr:transglutaminase domain-containing protein [Alphaproteobacteria bacterium]